MEALSQIGAWISANEALLSGIAAMIVVAGVIFTPLGAGLRRLLRAREDVPSGETAQPPAESPDDTAPEGRASIAVLPFANMSADEEQEFLADGMTEDIITGLAASRHLHVIARNSTFAYKGQSPDIRQVGRDLGVRYVLEGSIRRIGDNLRITVQLIQAEDGSHVWAEKYDRALAEIFATQDEVVNDIAGALSIRLTEAEASRARRKAPANLTAWERVAKAMWHHQRPIVDVAQFRSLRDQLREAVEIDPEYAHARAAYAWCLIMVAINGASDDAMAEIAEGREQLAKAIDLSTDEDPLTYYNIGAAWLYFGRHDRAVRFLEASLAKNPHQPDALAHLGLALAYLGQWDRAYETFDRADRAMTAGTVTFYSWYRAIALGLQGRYAEAIPILAPMLEILPRYGAARACLALAYDAVGDGQRARAEVARIVELDPEVRVDGIALLVGGSHPDPEVGTRRAETLKRYWPGA